MADGQQHPRCHLLALPRELRDEIFELALCTNTYTPRAEDPDQNMGAVRWLDDTSVGVFVSRNIYGWSERRHIYEAPALLVTNRQIRSEAGEIYYGKTNFLFSIWHFGPAWFVSLEPRFRKKVKALYWVDNTASSWMFRLRGGDVKKLQELFAARHGLDATGCLQELKLR